MARHPQRKAKPRSAAPVELTVTEIGARGDGLADHGGRRVYVPLTVPGDRVRVLLDAPRGDGIAARLLDLLEPGPIRAEPPCPHFGVCGGCALQHLDDQAYGDWKRAQVVTALARAGLTGIDVAPTVRTPPASRRRATFAAARRGGRVTLGFNERQSHRIADIFGCLVVQRDILALLCPLEDLLAAVLPDGGALDVTVTALEGGLDVLLTGGPEPGLDARERLAAFAESSDIARLSWRRSASSPPEPVAARRPVHIGFGGVAVPIEPGAFLQASAEGEAALVDAVLAAVGDARKVADLFAGLGTFTFPLARRGAVHAVEGDASAMAALSSAARTLPNVTTNVTVARRDLFDDPLTASELSHFDAVVFDPPRAGAREQSTQIAASGVPTVVAVSCNPATFARDARILTDGGYSLERVTPVDQFVWSAHVELVARFTVDR
jgi:23S rRNA (uracil1939-C5)-methyltransferase